MTTEAIQKMIDKGGKLAITTFRDVYSNTLDPEKQDIAKALKVAVESGELSEKTLATINDIAEGKHE